MADASVKLIPIEDRTYGFALMLVRASRTNPPRDEADRIIWRQLLKSGTSAGANTAESRGSQSKADWMAKRYIALREMREAQFWLRLLRDSSGKSAAEIATLIDEGSQLIAIMTASLKTARAGRG